MCACGCGSPAPIAQRTNRQFGHVKGQPIKYVNGHQNKRPGPHWSSEDRGYITPCRIWLNGTVKGYGTTKVAGRTRYTHIVEWEAVNGPVPQGCELDHLCKQPRCGEPTHLEPVPHVINTQRGAHVKLTRDAVIQICMSLEPPAVLAERFGVADRTIRNVREGRSWRNVVASMPTAAMPYGSVPLS